MPESMKAHTGWALGMAAGAQPRQKVQMEPVCAPLNRGCGIDGVSVLFWDLHPFGPIRGGLTGIPQMGPIRAQFWLPSAPLASWTRRIWRKTDRASGIGPIPRSKMAIFLSYGPTSPVSLSEPMTIERLILRGRSGGGRAGFRADSQEVGAEGFCGG